MRNCFLLLLLAASLRAQTPYQMRVYTNVADMAAQGSPLSVNKAAMTLGFATPGTGGAAYWAVQSGVTNASNRIASVLTPGWIWQEVWSVVPVTRTISTTNSLTGGGPLTTNLLLQLVNDQASPGTNKVYGTTTNGLKGWVTPVSSGTINSSNDFLPYRVDATTFGNSPLKRLDGGTVYLESTDPDINPTFGIRGLGTNAFLTGLAFELADSSGPSRVGLFGFYKAGAAWGLGTPASRDAGLSFGLMTDNGVRERIRMDGESGEFLIRAKDGVTEIFKVLNFSGYTGTGMNILADNGTYRTKGDLGITNGVPQERTITGIRSIVGGGNLSSNLVFMLDGDTPIPAGNQYYGTPPGSAVKGWYNLPESGGGEINLGDNLGTGVGVYNGKFGATLQFNSLLAGAGMTIVSNAGAGTVTLSSTATGGGEINTASHLGSGTTGPFNSKSGVDLRFNSFSPGLNITIVSNAGTLTFGVAGLANGIAVQEQDGAPNVPGVIRMKLPNGTVTDEGGGVVSFTPIVTTPGYSVVQDEGTGLTTRSTINFIGAGVTAVDNPGAGRTDVTIPGGGGGGGEVNLGANLGTGTVAPYASKSGVTLQFNSFAAGAGMTIVSNAGTITFTSTASGGGEVNTGENFLKGAGIEGPYKSKSGAMLQFNSLVAGANMTIVSNANGSLTFAAAAGGSGTIIGPLSGDVTTPNPSSGVTTLKNTGPGANSYGSATQIPVFTLDAQGRVTAVTPTTVAPPAVITRHIVLALSDPSVAITGTKTNYLSLPQAYTITAVKGRLFKGGSPAPVLKLFNGSNGGTPITTITFGTSGITSTNQTGSLTGTSISADAALVGEITTSGTAAQGAQLVISYTIP